MSNITRGDNPGAVAGTLRPLPESTYRRMRHGPVRPMQTPGLLARLFGLH
ncbi:hypothetical protein WAB17_08330 [Parerythrobacter aurantius]